MQGEGKEYTGVKCEASKKKELAAAACGGGVISDTQTHRTVMEKSAENGLWPHDIPQTD